MNPAQRLVVIAVALAAGACAQLPTGDKPAPTATPQVSQDSLRERANMQLTRGVEQYNAGEFDAAIRSLSGSLDHGMLSKVEQSRARKFMAFSHCVAGREAPCRDEFRKAFEINSDFSLTPAEDGHPIWGPVYRNVRTQLIAEREATNRKPITLLPLSKGEQMLADGIVQYDAGDYDAALRLLEGALKETLRDKTEQVRAMKHVAFSHCLKERYTACRTAFLRIYEVDPNFDLAPAEAGHPSWTRTFAAAKAQAKKDLAARESREKSAREKAVAPPAAAVPKKN